MDSWSAAALILLLLNAPAAGRPPGVQIPIVDATTALRAAVANPPLAPGPLTPKEREEVAALYDADGFVPLWVDGAGAPTADARDALALIAGAAADGLEPAQYLAAGLQDLATALAGPAARQASDIARFDVALSAGTLRYFRHLHIGRIDPRAIGFRMTAPADQHDFAALLRTALAEHRMAQTAASLAPPLVLYRSLREMLARYRTLASDPALAAALPPATVVKPGDPYPGVAQLHRLLVALGDLQADAAAPADAAPYAGPIVDAVKHFQVRHGLAADGVLGKTTQAELRVPLTRRVRQIELALERLRWLPHLSEDRFLAVNIPMFRLWVWDKRPAGGAPTLGMDVIVGRALNHQTPVFVEEMQYIIFRPYWNVPPSIVRSEIVPGLRRDPDYLRGHDMEIVSGSGEGSQATPSEEALRDLQRGRLRVRQRPGPKNSLGLVKFLFPNDDNVYLHSTPAPQLFTQSRRDFSHGCVRVADPVGLAEWALKDQPAWTRERIIAAMNAGQPTQVNLPKPIQVILFYVTAAVMPEDGTIRFAEDFYGHDAKLDRALAR